MNAPTPTGIPITHCDTCGRTHPITRAHCTTCELATIFPCADARCPRRTKGADT